MGGRDHSWECEVCGLDRGGMNDLLCDCDVQDNATTYELPPERVREIDDLSRRFAALFVDMTVDEVRAIVDGGRCWECNHLMVLHDYDGAFGTCNLCECEL